jgi:formyltetrahydrofolate deformylase
MKKYILTLSCRDRLGIVADVSGFLKQYKGFILESQQFGDTSTGNFFMRTVFVPKDGSPSLSALKTKFEPIAAHFNMQWELHLEEEKKRVMILVSKLGHCLNALLNKTALNNLQIEIPCIASNHSDLETMAEWYHTPYYHLPLTPETKREQESQILQLIEEHRIDLVVLARYMQILSPDFVQRMRGKIINIHHSFLPSFKGAKPYHQAHSLGVKLIGATAHYVSEILDEGPIIEQEVTRVDHTCPPEELVAIGQDIETTVLTRAVKWHAQHRVFLNGSKTVVFR